MDDLTQTLHEVGEDLSTQILCHVSGDTLLIIVNAANRTEFSLSIGDLDLEEQFTVIRRSLKIASIIWRLDGDLAESFDNAFRTKPKDSDIFQVQGFVKNHPETRSSLEHLLIS
ncbi:MAG: hypothetical protein AAGA60_30275 [Cyanobacteria bacterium P01_E01_bin.42]